MNDYKVFTPEMFPHWPARAEAIRTLNENGVILCAPSSFPKGDWPFRVVADTNGCFITTPSKGHHRTYTAWYVRRPDDDTKIVLVVFFYNATRRGEATDVLRQAFGPWHGIILVQPHVPFTVSLPTHHGHSTVRYTGIAQDDGTIKWQLAPPQHRTPHIPDDLPTYEPSDKLPITVMTKGGYSIREWDSGTLIRVDSAARYQPIAEVFIPKDAYGKLAALIASTRLVAGDDDAFVLETQRSIIHEYSDRHGARLLIVSPRDNIITVGVPNGRKTRFAVLPDGTFQRLDDA